MTFVILFHYLHLTSLLSSILLLNRFFSPFFFFFFFCQMGEHFVPCFMELNWLISKTEENKLLCCLPTEGTEWTRRNQKLKNLCELSSECCIQWELGSLRLRLRGSNSTQMEQALTLPQQQGGRGLKGSSGVALDHPPGSEAWRWNSGKENCSLAP